MTTDEILALPAGPILDAEVARVVFGMDVATIEFPVGCASVTVPKFSTSHDACVALLEEVEKRGAQYAYRTELRRRVLSEGSYYTMDWKMLTASPYEKCRAALLALQEPSKT